MQKVTEKSSIPKDIHKAISGTKKIESLWNDLTPIARRDFITWIESAKQLETRARRIGITCDKLLSGKRRPCCYAVVPMGLYKALDENPQAKTYWKTLTPDERRNIAAWVDNRSTKDTKKARIDKAILALSRSTTTLR
jgi:uncharacterized protein YdeI (YjbR/CyaY-like superfamily)